MARQASDAGGIGSLLNNENTLNNAVAASKGGTNGVPYKPNVPLTPPRSAAPAAPSVGSAGATGSLQQFAQPNSYATSAPMAATGAAPADATATPAAPQMSQDDYLAGDSTYQSALAALQKTLSGYQNDYVQNLSKYDTDYNTGLKNLGWNSDGSWNQDDTNTAYGRSYNNQLNDFGSRDMLSSSFYGDALNNMARQFNDQKSSIDTARTNYRDDQRSTLNAENDQVAQSKQQALAEAIARMAAGVSVSGT